MSDTWVHGLISIWYWFFAICKSIQFISHLLLISRSNLFAHKQTFICPRHPTTAPSVRAQRFVSFPKKTSGRNYEQHILNLLKCFHSYNLRVISITHIIQRSTQFDHRDFTIMNRNKIKKTIFFFQIELTKFDVDHFCDITFTRDIIYII